MGHSSVLTTLHGYGHVSVERQGGILGRLPRFGQDTSDAENPRELAAKLAEMLARRG